MRNRSTDLIEWNDTLSEGTGWSGSHYTLSYDHPAGAPPRDVRGHWLIVVDGFTLSSARSVQDALARSEGLEALRCILQGRHPTEAALLSRARVAARGYDGFRFRRRPRRLALR